MTYQALASHPGIRIFNLALVLGLSTAGRAAELPAFPDGEGAGLRIRARCGAVGEGIDLVWRRDGREDLRLNLRTSDMLARNHHWGLKVEGGIESLTDAGILITLSGNHGWQVMDGKRRASISRLMFVRPDVHFYQQSEDQAKALAAWNDLPSASAHRLDLRLVRRDGLLSIWVDGNFFVSTPFANWEGPELSATDGAEILSAAQWKTPETRDYLPLNLEHHPHAPERTAGASPLGTGAQAIGGIPFKVLAAERAMDVGRSRWLAQERDDQSFYNPYYRRSAWDAIPESLIRSIPRDHYRRLHLICTADPARRPEMTVRLARYRQTWDGSGATQADIDLNLASGAETPAGVQIRRIGDLQPDAGGAPWPLYRVSLPLPTGELADYLRFEGMDWNETSDFFYLEFSRKIETRVTINNGVFERLPLGPQSGIQVLAATLEKAPVRVYVESEALGHVFEAPEPPVLSVRLVNDRGTDRPVTLNFRFTDYFGVSHDREFTATARADAETVSRVPLDDLPVGWYDAELRVADPGGETFWREPLTLALLPPDTRRAGFDDAPHYGTWWFQRSHYSEAHADRALPLIRKMGFRYVSAGRWLDGGRQAETYGILPEVYAKYGISPSQIKVSQGAWDVRNPPEPEVLEKAYRDLYARWPDVRYAMLFHEMRGMGSLGIELPPELLGKPIPAIEGEEAEWRDLLKAHIERHARAIRAGAPGLKIILGNSGPNFNMHWAREDLPREAWDALGMEQAMQLFSPEGQPTGWNTQSFWLARRMLDLYGYEDLPVTTCYEVGYRVTAAGGLSLKRQADWYARDVLLMLAHRVPDVNIALLMDANSAYYTSRWGSTGVLTRYPAMQPKPSYVALATLTRVLDLAKFRRALDTGSYGLHAMEFSAPDGFVSVFWTARGDVDVALELPDDAQVLWIDLMGRETALPVENGAVSLRATESPVFVRTPQPLAAARAGTWRHDRVQPRPERTV